MTELCCAPNCKNQIQSKTKKLCDKHRTRLRRYGSYELPIRLTLEDRLRASSLIDKRTNCWNWQLRINNHGYGVAYHQNKQYKAHRLSYMTFIA